MALQDKLRKLIADKLGIDPEKVVPEASFIDDLGADSLDLVELVMSLEEQFCIEISDEDAERLITVKDAYDYIKADGDIDLQKNDSNYFLSGKSTRNTFVNA